ncbi:CYTH domain-containing protein, partial [Blastococcus sp. CCUG 61487]|uniref:CYTH domain-containing protein n=1 Tax=Blastococcus sp. CCUG 61487 TaxID=1840703 RepID=UPI0014850F4F
MRAGHLEIETKFDVSPSFVVPDLIGTAGVATADAPVEHALEARYFDTADLRLAGARITLRRRTGGPDDGWHVKLPAARDARVELRRPLGRAARPPKAVLDPLAGVLRGEPPVPVAELHTRRVVTVLRDADGRAMAEIADDVVTATRLTGPRGAAEVRSWREVEVELIDGPAELLGPVGERLVAAGAEWTARASKLARALGLDEVDRPAPPGRAAEPRAADVLLGVLRDQVTALQLADVAVRTGQDDAIRR